MWWDNPEKFQPKVERFSDYKGYFPGANLGDDIATLYNKAAMEEMYGRKLGVEMQNAYSHANQSAPMMQAMGVKPQMMQQHLGTANQIMAPQFKPSGIAETFGAERLAMKQSDQMNRLMSDIKEHNAPGFWDKYGSIILNLAMTFGPGLVGGMFGGGAATANAFNQGIGGSMNPNSSAFLLGG